MTPAQQHRQWRPDVLEVVHELERAFPSLEAVTYRDHPWPGWDGQSIDLWGEASSWTPARLNVLRLARDYVMERQGRPLLRHTILRHRLWTSFGGYSRWKSDDHSGDSLHLHLTYW